MKVKSRNIVYVGGHDLGYKCLKYLIEENYNVILCIGRKDDEPGSFVFPSVLELAREHNIPTLRPEKINDLKVINIVKSLRSEIALSIQNNRIFKENWIDYFNALLGIVNIHLSPLPRYGGFWPEMWAIWNDEKLFGITMHYIDHGVDTGRIIAQYPIEIIETETRKTLYDKCVQAAFKMFKDNINSILFKKMLGQEQDLTKKSYFKRELPNNGFIDFSWDAKKIERFIRALSFYPFVGPKMKIGDRIISTVDCDLEFYKPIIFKTK